MIWFCDCANAGDCGDDAASFSAVIPFLMVKRLNGSDFYRARCRLVPRWHGKRNQTVFFFSIFVELAIDANGCDDDGKRVKREFACHRFVVSSGKHHVNRNRSIKLHFSPSFLCLHLDDLADAKSFIGLWKVEIRDFGVQGFN